MYIGFSKNPWQDERERIGKGVRAKQTNGVQVFEDDGLKTGGQCSPPFIVQRILFVCERNGLKRNLQMIRKVTNGISFSAR